MTPWTLETTIGPSHADLEVLHAGLRAYNLSQLGREAFGKYVEVAVFARAGDGTIIAGVCGELLWEWLHIGILWVAEEYRGRGIGSRLLQAIEQAALAQGTAHVHLETTSFQALDFYRRYGYTLFGELKGKPTGHDWYFLQKALT